MKFLSQVAVVYHPGETLAEKLNEMGMGVKEFAVRTCKPEKTIIAVIKGDSAITTEMAVLFECVTKIPAKMWIKMQRRYDEYLVRINREKQAYEEIEWMERFPIEEMVRLGWISSCQDKVQRVNTLYDYFGVSSKRAWYDYYINQELKIAFRISLMNTSDPYAISVWLRQGEILSSTIALNITYSEKNLRAVLSDIAQVTENMRDCFKVFRNMLASVGVKLICVPSLTSVSMNAATRWINDVPIIQLSSEVCKSNILAFTIFHEIGHIVLHGKKEIFLEESTSIELNKEKELEADNFAKKFVTRPRSK